MPTAVPFAAIVLLLALMLIAAASASFPSSPKIVAAASASASISPMLSASASASISPPPPSRKVIRYVSRVSYDGHGFKGWQDQGHESNQRTVQGAIGKQLSQRFNRRVTAVGAGRTDCGVHARGQVMHFDLFEPLGDTKDFEYTFNRMLPSDIRVYNLTEACRTLDYVLQSAAVPGNAEQAQSGEIFHATKSAAGKLYSYRFCTNAFVEPMRRNQVAHVYYPIDLALFAQCLQSFVGTHDFRAFGNRVEKSMKDFEAKDGLDFETVRTVHSVTLTQEDPLLQGAGYYRVDFRIDSAIYRMIRNLVGASLCVASGNMEMDAMRQLLADAPFRVENKAMSAPACGLTLEHVFYDHY